MPEYQEIADAFTDIPQAEAMQPPVTKDDDEGTDDTPAEDLTVQGGE